VDAKEVTLAFRNTDQHWRVNFLSRLVHRFSATKSDILKRPIATFLLSASASTVYNVFILTSF
jgi:hypothetical protein